MGSLSTAEEEKELSTMELVYQCLMLCCLLSTAAARGVAYMGHGTNNGDNQVFIKDAGHIWFPVSDVPVWLGPLFIGLVLLVLLLIMARICWVRTHENRDTEDSGGRRDYK